MKKSLQIPLFLVLGFLLAKPFVAAADGNVKVIVKGTNIKIIGDNNGNDVQLIPSNGMLEVRGLNSTSVDVPMTGVAAMNVGKMIVKLKDGNNFLQINNGITFNGKLLIMTSSGSDKIDFFGGTLNGKVIISSGSGSDIIDITNPTFNNKVKIKAGSSNDNLTLGVSSPVTFTPTFNNKLNVNMGGDNDFVIVKNDALNGVSAVLSGGGGNDDITPDQSVLEAQGVKVKKFEQ